MRVNLSPESAQRASRALAAYAEGCVIEIQNYRDEWVHAFTIDSWIQDIEEIMSGTRWRSRQPVREWMICPREAPYQLDQGVVVRSGHYLLHERHPIECERLGCVLVREVRDGD